MDKSAQGPANGRDKDRAIWELVILLALAGIWAIIILHPNPRQPMSMEEVMRVRRAKALAEWNKLAPSIDPRIDKEVIPYIQDVAVSSMAEMNPKVVLDSEDTIRSLLNDHSLNLRSRITLAYWVLPQRFFADGKSYSLVSPKLLDEITSESRESQDLEARWLATLSIMWYYRAKKHLEDDQHTPTEEVLVASDLLDLASKREPDNGWYREFEADKINQVLNETSHPLKLNPQEKAALTRKAITCLLLISAGSHNTSPERPPFTEHQGYAAGLNQFAPDYVELWSQSNSDEWLSNKFLTAENMEDRLDRVMLAVTMVNVKEENGDVISDSSNDPVQAGIELLKKQVEGYFEYSVPPPPQMDLANQLQAASRKMVSEAQPWWQDEVIQLFQDLQNSTDRQESKKITRGIYKAITDPPTITSREAGDKLRVYWRELTQGEPAPALYREYLELLSDYLILLKKQHPRWATPRFWELHKELSTEVSLILDDDLSLQGPLSDNDDATQERNNAYERRRLKDLDAITKERPEFIAQMKSLAEWLHGFKGQEKKAEALEKLASQFSDPPSKSDPDAEQVGVLLQRMADNNLYPAVEGYFEKTRPVINMAGRTAEFVSMYTGTWSPVSGDIFSNMYRSSEKTMRLRAILTKIYLEAYDITKLQRRKEAK